MLPVAFGECILTFLTFGVCLNPGSQWEDDHHYFTKGPGIYPSLSTAKVFGQAPRNDIFVLVFS